MDYYAADTQRSPQYPLPRVWEISALLKEFINMYQNACVQAMLQEGEMQVIEQSSRRYISVISYYEHLGKLMVEFIFINCQQWVRFRDSTGVTGIEICTLPFTEPLQSITSIDLKHLGGWNDSPVRHGIRPILVGGEY